jgi:hypothetical protein
LLLYSVFSFLIFREISNSDYNAYIYDSVYINQQRVQVMKHTIDTKVIQELAAMSPEVKVYLEKEFPDAFKQKIDFTKDLVIDPEYPDVLVKCGSLNEDGLMIPKTIYNLSKDIWKLRTEVYRRATTEEIQLFIPDYKPG